VLTKYNISSLSRLGVQVSEHVHSVNFRAIPAQTAAFTTAAFAFPFPFHILTVLSSNNIQKLGIMVSISVEDRGTFQRLNDRVATASLKTAMAKFSTRKKADEDNEDL
jgi:hypothetical protein